ncbi:MAG: hypothetical protein JWQ36_288 [Enterovirga sp.]|jgi:hypothetical protein|nr:hypothetical protein [Enterovirga sp.]
MRSGGKSSFSSHASLETRCDAMLLGKLGHELANIYHDSLQAPLPSGLRSLIDRLEAALDQGEEPAPQPATAREHMMR